MRRWLAPSLFAAALLAGPAVAEDGKTYTIPAKVTWKVGDVVTRRESEKKTQKLSIKTPDGTEVPPSGETVESTSYEAVMKVLAVDATGELTKAVVFFTSWSTEKGGAEDKSLAGKHVELDGSGANRKVTVLDDGDLSAEAREWVTNEIGSKSAVREDKMSVLYPAKPVAVGESWDVDPAKIAAALGDDLTVVPAKSTAKVSLVAVEDGLAKLKMEINLQTANLPTPAGPMEWSEGGAMVISLTTSRAIEAGKHTSDGEGTITFQGKGNMQGADVSMDIKSENSMHVTEGGEIPERKPSMR
jgi:hypothetical protein